MKIIAFIFSLCCATSALADCGEGMVPTSYGKCMPSDAIECGNGYCTAGWDCSSNNTCIKTHFGPAYPNGPTCPGFNLPCPYGTACGPQGQCYFPDRTHVCPNGKIYLLSDACP